MPGGKRFFRTVQIEHITAFRIGEQQRKCHRLGIRIRKAFEALPGKERGLPFSIQEIKRRLRILEGGRHFFPQQAAQRGEQLRKGPGILGDQGMPGQEVAQQRFKSRCILLSCSFFTGRHNVAGKPDERPPALPILIQSPFIAVRIENVGKRPETFPLRFVMAAVTRGIRPLAGPLELNEAAERAIGVNGIIRSANFLNANLALAGNVHPENLSRILKIFFQRAAELFFRLTGAGQLQLG
ncbi:MAG: hypothetical protein K2N62_10365 [Desulfovibrio sp.]|nr:hypothetical protein [Desulfovibrio sp.]